MQKENFDFIKAAFIEKADEINNYADCDVIQECRNEVYKTIQSEGVRVFKENLTALANACGYRVGMQDARVRYMASIIKELPTA